MRLAIAVLLLRSHGIVASWLSPCVLDDPLCGRLPAGPWVARVSDFEVEILADPNGRSAEELSKLASRSFNMSTMMGGAPPIARDYERAMSWLRRHQHPLRCSDSVVATVTLPGEGGDLAERAYRLVSKSLPLLLSGKVVVIDGDSAWAALPATALASFSSCGRHGEGKEDERANVSAAAGHGAPPPEELLRRGSGWWFGVLLAYTLQPSASVAEAVQQQASALGLPERFASVHMAARGRRAWPERYAAAARTMAARLDSHHAAAAAGAEIPSRGGRVLLASAGRAAAVGGHGEIYAIASARHLELVELLLLSRSSMLCGSMASLGFRAAAAMAMSRGGLLAPPVAVDAAEAWPRLAAAQLPPRGGGGHEIGEDAVLAPFVPWRAELRSAPYPGDAIPSAEQRRQ